MFLKGLIPLWWLGRAFELGSLRALGVALAVWFKAGLRGTKEGLSLATADLKHFGVTNRWAKYDGLAALEGVGLIRVARRPGKNPLVTILDRQATAAG